jgi:hypothetical protein
MSVHRKRDVRFEQAWLRVGVPAHVEEALWRRLDAAQRHASASTLSIGTAMAVLGEERDWGVIGELAGRIGDTDAVLGTKLGAGRVMRLWLTLAASSPQQRPAVLKEACETRDGRTALAGVLRRDVWRWRHEWVKRLGLGSDAEADAAVVGCVPIDALWAVCAHDTVLADDPRVTLAALLRLSQDAGAAPEGSEDDEALGVELVGRGEARENLGVWPLVAVLTRCTPSEEAATAFVGMQLEPAVASAVEAWLARRPWHTPPFAGTEVRQAVEAACAWQWLKSSPSVAGAHDDEIRSVLDELEYGDLPVGVVLLNPALSGQQRRLVLAKIDAREAHEWLESQRQAAQAGVSIDEDEFAAAVERLLDHEDQDLTGPAAVVLAGLPGPVRARIAGRFSGWKLEQILQDLPELAVDLETLLAVDADVAMRVGDGDTVAAWIRGQLGEREAAWSALLAVLGSGSRVSLADAVAAALEAAR